MTTTGTPVEVVRLSPEVHAAACTHAIRSLPDEGCGLLAAVDEAGVLDEFHPVANAAASSERYELDGAGMLAAEHTAERGGRTIVGVMHSHVATSAWPSPTDIAESGRFDPDGVYVHLIVSLRHPEPACRAYRIRGGDVVELRLVVAEPDTAAGGDDLTAPAAAAAVIRLADRTD